MAVRKPDQNQTLRRLPSSQLGTPGTSLLVLLCGIFGRQHGWAQSYFEELEFQVFVVLFFQSLWHEYWHADWWTGSLEHTLWISGGPTTSRDLESLWSWLLPTNTTRKGFFLQRDSNPSPPVGNGYDPPPTSTKPLVTTTQTCSLMARSVSMAPTGSVKALRLPTHTEVCHEISAISSVWRNQHRNKN